MVDLNQSHDFVSITGGAVVALLIWIFKNNVSKSIDRLGLSIEKISTSTATQDVEIAKLRTHLEHMHTEMFGFSEMVKKIYLLESQSEASLRNSAKVLDLSRDIDFLHESVRRLERKAGDQK